MIRFAHARIDHRIARTPVADGPDYPAAVVLLRAIHDMIGRVKCWDETPG
ncbi:MAG TPA: hypothetical protein VK726_14470 [Acetobacteraceae bacterium]|nr:hypothetical protein [Acetobacteraceae bacterium]